MSRKTRSTGSATDLARISPHLPSIEADEKKRVELEQLFSTAARAGAGGTKAGLVGLRPSGKKGIDFLDSITPQRKKQKRAYDQDLNLGTNDKAPKREVDAHAKIMLPRNFCPDCGRAGLSKPGVCINFNNYPEGRPEWRLGPQDLMISFFCNDCFEAQRAKPTDNANELYLAEFGHDARKKGDVDNAARLVRIKQHTEEFVRARLAVNDESIYVKR